MRQAAEAEGLLLAGLDDGEDVVTSWECTYAHKGAWPALRGVGWMRDGTRPRDIHGATGGSRDPEAERKGDTQNEACGTMNAPQKGGALRLPRAHRHFKQT